MFWIEGVTRTFTGLELEIITSNGVRKLRDTQQLAQQLEFSGSKKVRVRTDCSDWQREYGSPFWEKLGIQDLKPKDNQGVYRFDADQKRYLIPVSVFIQALMRPLQKIHKFLFKPQGLETFCTPILEENIPKLGLNLSMRELFDGHNKLPSWFECTYSWMSCFPSANNMWASVYQSAVSGHLDIDLPKASLAMTMTSVKHSDVYLVTKILITHIAASEEPFKFAPNHAKDINLFRHSMSNRLPTYSHETESCVRENTWKLSNEEWQTISTLVTQRKGQKHDMREIINLILYKHGTGCPWRQLPFGTLNFPIVQNTYHRLTKNGNWAKASETLNTMRTAHIGSTADTDSPHSPSLAMDIRCADA
jgi:transposase